MTSIFVTTLLVMLSPLFALRLVGTFGLRLVRWLS